MKRVVTWSELPPSQAGLSAALRRAFQMPPDERSCEFDDLLKRI